MVNAGLEDVFCRYCLYSHCICYSWDHVQYVHMYFY